MATSLLAETELHGATERMLVADLGVAEPRRQVPSDWTEHDGGECPVSDLARVLVRFRGDRDHRAAVRGNHPDGISAYMVQGWIHDGGSSDVVAFKVVA